MTIPKFETSQPPAARRIRPGEPIRADFLNQQFAEARESVRGVQPPRQVSPAANQALRRFVVKSVGVDVLVCRTWDGTNEGATDVNVALPWLLRKTPFDGQTIGPLTYTYTSNTEREVTDGVDIETQLITPDYAVDDEVFTLPILTSVLVLGVDVGLIDVNLGGRAWAALI